MTQEGEPESGNVDRREMLSSTFAGFLALAQSQFGRLGFSQEPGDQASQKPQELLLDPQQRKHTEFLFDAQHPVVMKTARARNVAKATDAFKDVLDAWSAVLPEGILSKDDRVAIFSRETGPRDNLEICFEIAVLSPHGTGKDEGNILQPGHPKLFCQLDFDPKQRAQEGRTRLSDEGVIQLYPPFHQLPDTVISETVLSAVSPDDAHEWANRIQWIVGREHPTKKSNPFGADPMEGITRDTPVEKLPPWVNITLSTPLQRNGLPQTVMEAVYDTRTKQFVNKPPVSVQEDHWNVLRRQRGGDDVTQTGQ